MRLPAVELIAPAERAVAALNDDQTLFTVLYAVLVPVYELVAVCPPTANRSPFEPVTRPGDFLPVARGGMVEAEHPVEESPVEQIHVFIEPAAPAGWPVETTEPSAARGSSHRAAKRFRLTNTVAVFPELGRGVTSLT
jgi:hypothetical protein